MSIEKVIQALSLVIGVFGLAFGYYQFIENTRLQREASEAQAKLAELAIQAQLASSSKDDRPRVNLQSVDVLFLEEAGGLTFEAINFGNRATSEICTSYSGIRFDNLKHVDPLTTRNCFDSRIDPGEKFDLFVQISTNLNSSIGSLPGVVKFQEAGENPHLYLDCDPGLFKFYVSYTDLDGNVFEDRTNVIIGSKTLEPGQC